MADVIKGRAGLALLESARSEATRPFTPRTPPSHTTHAPTHDTTPLDRLDADPVKAATAIFKLMQAIYRATGNMEPVVEAMCEVSRRSNNSYPPPAVQEATVRLFAQEVLDEVMKRIAHHRHSLATVSIKEYEHAFAFGTHEEKVALLAKCSHFADPPRDVLERFGVTQEEVTITMMEMAWVATYPLCKCGVHHPPVGD